VAADDFLLVQNQTADESRLMRIETAEIKSRLYARATPRSNGCRPAVKAGAPKDYARLRDIDDAQPHRPLFCLAFSLAMPLIAQIQGEYIGTIGFPGAKLLRVELSIDREANSFYRSSEVQAFQEHRGVRDGRVRRRTRRAVDKKTNDITMEFRKWRSATPSGFCARLRPPYDETTGA
jgi:hypothetical protein